MELVGARLALLCHATKAAGVAGERDNVVFGAEALKLRVLVLQKHVEENPEGSRPGGGCHGFRWLLEKPEAEALGKLARKAFDLVLRAPTAGVAASGVSSSAMEHMVVAHASHKASKAAKKLVVAAPPVAKVSRQAKKA